MGRHPTLIEDQAILKPIWSPAADRVRRGSGKWRLWALGPKPAEGAWFPRDDLWVWKWWAPHVSDHGEWLWRGEEPVFEMIPDSAESGWRFVGSQPSLQWLHAQDTPAPKSHYDRIWTEESGTLCFAGEKDETLQFVALSRVHHFMTDRTTLVFDQESEEIPIHEELIERMRRSGDPLSSELLSSTRELMPPAEHLNALREHSTRALEGGLEVGVALLEAQRGHLSAQELLENYLGLLCLDLDLWAAELEGVQGGVSKVRASPRRSPDAALPVAAPEGTFNDEIRLPQGVLRLTRVASGEGLLRSERLKQPSFLREVELHLQRLLANP